MKTATKKQTPLFTLKKMQSNFPSVKIQSSKDAADFIRQFYSDDLVIFESFFILTLDRQNITTGYVKISQGGIAGTIVDLKLIAKYGVENLANGIILAHNHPSGNLQPSEEDIKITKKAVDALKLLDIKVYDHIILTETSYCSLSESGYIY